MKLIIFCRRFASAEVDLSRPGNSLLNFDLKPQGMNKLSVVVSQGVVGALQFETDQAVRLVLF